MRHSLATNSHVLVRESLSSFAESLDLPEASQLHPKCRGHTLKPATTLHRFHLKQSTGNNDLLLQAKLRGHKTVHAPLDADAVVAAVKQPSLQSPTTIRALTKLLLPLASLLSTSQHSHKSSLVLSSHLLMLALCSNHFTVVLSLWFCNYAHSVFPSNSIEKRGPIFSCE
ncbi:hypothetical protein VNO80_18935 [Phaseolus coccineus]|uniref:Uncharacterized protein n=1 Tax=Phaseolus coccineus TaxID=3886 RepID=A0AAN9MFI6_PHACN